MDETSGLSEPERSTGGGAERGILKAVGAAIVVGFVVLVVTSIRQAAVPVGASGGMAGMSMPGGGGGGTQVSTRSIDGRKLSIPNGRPGVVVFIKPRGCAACATAVRASARAVSRGARQAELTVVAVDSATEPQDLAAFARKVDAASSRYVIDDRDGSLVSIFAARGLGVAVVYDSAGKVVGQASSSGDIAHGVHGRGPGPVPRIRTPGPAGGRSAAARNHRVAERRTHLVPRVARRASRPPCSPHGRLGHVRLRFQQRAIPDLPRTRRMGSSRAARSDGGLRDQSS